MQVRSLGASLTYIDAPGVKFSWMRYKIRHFVYDVTFTCNLSTLKLILQYIDILATGRLININELTFDEAN